MHDRSDELEGVRGLMALWVVVYHLLVIPGASVPDMFAGGHAVSVFFALSGFVIARMLVREPQPYGVFLTRRFMRLFPVYALCVAASVLLAHADVVPLRVPRDTEALHIALHAVMLHGLVPAHVLPGAGGALLNPAWSVSVEWQFYLLVPAFFALHRRRPALAWAMLALITALAQRVLAPLKVTGAALSPHIHLFTLGIVTSFVYTWISARKLAVEPGARALPLLIPAVLVAMVPLQASVGTLFWCALAGCLLCTQAGASSAAVDRGLGVLRAKPLVRLGAISYALYLVHEPIVWSCLRLVRLTLPSLQGAGLVAATGGLALPLAVLAALLLHHLVELPCIRLGRQWTRTSSGGARSAQLG